MRYKRMIGEKVYLTGLIQDDAKNITKWMNDPEITEFLDAHREVNSLNSVNEQVAEFIKTGTAFAIFDIKTEALIGYCVLDCGNINLLIGEKAYWHKGYDTEAVGFVLDFGFNLKNCNDISACAYSHDTRMLGFFEELGFTKTTVKRERLLRGRQKYDQIFFSMLAREYFERERQNA